MVNRLSSNRESISKIKEMRNEVSGAIVLNFYTGIHIITGIDQNNIEFRISLNEHKACEAIKRRISDVHIISYEHNGRHYELPAITRTTAEWVVFGLVQKGVQGPFKIERQKQS